jgi:pSer/pThr/pTyr-binding forkhead associated (FHA) protein
VRRTAPQYSLWIWAIILALSLTLAVLVLLLYRSRSRVAREHVLSQMHFATAALIRADEPQARYVIANTPWRIGRDPDNELVINDNSVSRHHAEIIHGRANSFLIRDLDSLNGIFVNDKRVQIATLAENDEVDVGDVRFRFELQSSVLETRAESR